MLFALPVFTPVLLHYEDYVYSSHLLRLFSVDGSAIPAHVKQINGTLQFEKVTRSDAGNFTCVASNRPQGEIRAYVSLTVGGEMN